MEDKSQDVAKPLRVKATTVIDIVKRIVDLGLEAEFRKGADAYSDAIEVSPALVAYVRSFIVERKLHEADDVLEHVANAPSCF